MEPVGNVEIEQNLSRRGFERLPAKVEEKGCFCR